MKSDLEIRKKYIDALEILACRSLAEPYTFHQVAALCSPAMFDTETVFARIMKSALKQYAKSATFSPQTIGQDIGEPIDIVSAYGMRHIETDLSLSLDWFYQVYGQYVEATISDYVPGWIMRGLTSEQIRIEAEKMRGKMGLRSRHSGDDGIASFEQRLILALDGVSIDYPVKHYLAAFRQEVPFFEPTDYVCTAALSGVGKTYDAVNMLHYNSLRGVKGLYINLEMDPGNLIKRMWQIESGERFQFKLQGPDAITARRIEALERVKKLPFKTINPGQQLPNVVSAIRQHWNEYGTQYAIIDYVQLMNVPGYKGGRNYELGEISATLRSLALELKIPIFAMAQLGKHVIDRADKRGGAYDIKDSANFTQDCVFVNLLYRPECFKIKEAPDGQYYPEGYADIHTAKGRETGEGITECRFDPIHGFHDISVPEFQPSAGIVANRSEEVPF